jgi:hypothetical protein
MKSTKRVIKFIEITEYKNLEKYLEKKAMQGLMLSEMKTNTLVFEKTVPRELTFNVSLFYHTSPFEYPDEEKDEDYRELCEESGWKYCANNNVYQIFWKEKNDDIDLIHTDPNEEYKIVKKVFMKTNIMSMLLIFLYFTIGMLNILRFDFEVILSNLTLFNLIWPFFLVVIWIVIYTLPVIWMIRNKSNSAKGMELTYFTDMQIRIKNIVMWSLFSIYFILFFISFTEIGRSIYLLALTLIPIIFSAMVAIFCIKRFKTKKRSKKQNIVFFSALSIFTMIISIGAVTLMMTTGAMSLGARFDKNDVEPEEILVLELSDFNTYDEPERTRMYEKSSGFSPINFEYYESLGRKPENNEIVSVRTRYIECKDDDIAEYVFDGYMKKEQERIEKRILEYQEYGNEKEVQEERNKINVISNDVWNVDRGFYLYNDNSKVIIQKGNIIYVLDSDVDFSKSEIIDIVKMKLEL